MLKTRDCHEKMTHAPKYVTNKKATILWNLVKMFSSWLGNIVGISGQIGKNCGFFISSYFGAWVIFFVTVSSSFHSAFLGIISSLCLPKMTLDSAQNHDWLSKDRFRFNEWRIVLFFLISSWYLFAMTVDRNFIAEYDGWIRNPIVKDRIGL